MVDRESKLFDPRNVEGKSRSSEILAKLRVLEVFLDDYPEFVGVAIRGSLYRGYADLSKGSDVDFIIIVDGKKESVARNAVSIAQIQKQFTNQNSEFHFLGLVDVSDGKFLPGNVEGESSILVALLEKTSGKRITQYRDRAKQWLETLNDADRQYVFDFIKWRIRDREWASMQKYVFRKLDAGFQHMDDNWLSAGYQLEKEAIKNARSGLWEGVQTVAMNPKFNSLVKDEVERRMQEWYKRIEEIFGFEV